jgi:hypothetical protein
MDKPFRPLSDEEYADLPVVEKIRYLRRAAELGAEPAVKLTFKLDALVDEVLDRTTRPH